jgi:hypothetical protein
MKFEKFLKTRCEFVEETIDPYSCALYKYKEKWLFFTRDKEIIPIDNREWAMAQDRSTGFLIDRQTFSMSPVPSSDEDDKPENMPLDRFLNWTQCVSILNEIKAL